MNTNCEEQENQPSWVQIGLNIVIHSLLFLFTAYVIYLSFSQSVILFSWHPALSTLGYVMFMTEGILTFAENNLITRNRNFKWRVKLHWILQAVGGACIILSTISIIAHKFINDKSHFKTYHAIVGLITIILTVLVAVGGIWTKYSYGLRQYLRPVRAKLIHAISGIILYILAVISLILGMYSNFFVRYSFSSAIWVGGFILIFSGIYILIKPLTTCVSRFKTALMRGNL